MSFNIEGKKCKACNAYLFPEDDVVFCPECGAPHHRECYKRLGHCALEDLHGTDAQYDSSKEEPKQVVSEPETVGETEQKKVLVKCGMCGESYSASENACPNCNTPNPIKMGGRFVSFDFLGGVPADMDIGDGVTADEAKQFVLTNTQRFIPKFAKMKNGSKVSFNILAFFFPCAWALSRKMYKLGALLGAVEIAASMLLIPFQKMVLNVVPDEVLNDYMKFAPFITDNIQLFNKTTMFVAFAASFIALALKIVTGIFADSIYRKYTINSIKEIKESSDDVGYDMRKKGGVSLLLLLLGVALTGYLPPIIASFAGL